MVLLLVSSAFWLKILMILGAVPLVCLFLGVLVCFMDSSALGTFDGAPWYQVSLGLMVMGAFVALVLVIIGGVTMGLEAAMMLCFGDGSPLIAFVLALLLVLGGIGLWGETAATKANREEKAQDELE